MPDQQTVINVTVTDHQMKILGHAIGSEIAQAIRHVMDPEVRTSWTFARSFMAAFRDGSDTIAKAIKARAAIHP